MKSTWRHAYRVYGSAMNDQQALNGIARGAVPTSPQGWPFIIGVSVPMVLAALLNWSTAAAILLLSLIFVVNFFRDPKREVPQGDGRFISPADGKVIRAEVRDNHLRVDTFMNIFNVHVNRAPMDGGISDMTYTRGQFVNASFNEASDQNERKKVQYA